MGFGAIIASGPSNALLRAELVDCLIEVRVEQSLDEPTRYGVRVREDFNAGDLMAARAPEFAKDTILTIAVEDENNELVGLVRGPITDSTFEMTLGGPGSWYEVHGSDRRIELARDAYQYVWEGLASSAVDTILKSNGFKPDVQDTVRHYDKKTQTLNQHGTDLDLLKAIARENNYFFWISLHATRQPALLGDGMLSVTETACFKTSPYRSVAAGSIPPSIPVLTLVPSVKPVIRAGVGSHCGNNVTSFQVKEDVERPTMANIAALDQRSLSIDTGTAGDTSTAAAKGGRMLGDVTGLKRALVVTAAGDASDVTARAQAALADTGWFITATASTTAHMLGGVLQPHDIVVVEAIGRRYSVPFRVRKVTHVITASDHYMDLELQGNSHLET